MDLVQEYNERNARELGISYDLFQKRVRDLKWPVEKAATKKVNKKHGTNKRKSKAYYGDYAVYKGDELIIIGTAEECAERLNVNAKYIRWLSTPSVVKRHDSTNKMIAIKIDEEE